MAKLTAVPDHVPEPESGDVPADWPALRASFVLALRVAGRTPATITTYTDSLDQFARWFGEHAPGRLVEHATRDDLRAFFVDLDERGLKPNTRATRHRSLRALYRFLVDEEIIATNPMANIPTPSITGERVPPVLTREQVDRMVKACGPRNTFVGSRDRALLDLISSSGLRASECLGLEEDDLVLDSDTPYVVVRHAKGGRIREAAVSHAAALAVSAYLRQRRKHRDAQRPELWLSRTGRPMTRGGLRQMISDTARRAGLGFPVSTHSLRHTATDHMLSRMSEHAVATQLGHTSLKQLGRYGKARAVQRSREEFFR